LWPLGGLNALLACGRLLLALHRLLALRQHGLPLGRLNALLAWERLLAL
jgi:hypothetical protein